MLIAMVAWAFRFGFFAIGNPSFPAVTWFILSMIVYGVAFDFFNISGSLFVNNETDSSIRSSAQGLFMIMTNGIGATIGTLGAQAVVNNFVPMEQTVDEVVVNGTAIAEGWGDTWLIFAGYALVVAVAFMLLFRYKHEPQKMANFKH